MSKFNDSYLEKCFRCNKPVTKCKCKPIVVNKERNLAEEAKRGKEIKEQHAKTMNDKLFNL